MKAVPSNPAPPATPLTPPACPSCRCTLTVTTTTIPNEDSYWRCTKCGDVWNVSRARTDRFGGQRWR